MKSGTWKVVLVASSFALPDSAAAQTADHSHHSESAEAELGRVEFRVSCAPEARRGFDRAVAMLHSFWYEEAAKAFAQVAAGDPRCAMAYWGEAMSLYHPIWYPPDADALATGRAAVEKARAIRAPTRRERAYIEAIGAFYDGSERLDHASRALAYERAMERLHRAYPADREASAFYALALLGTAPPTDRTFANQKKAAALLDSIAEALPRHPGVFHYYIHAYDTPELAPLALPAARGYAKVAPAVPHALHMPSHIFTRLGLWQDSIASNLASAEAARAYATRVGLPGAYDQELHALDYLMYAYLQQGDDAKAKGVLERVREIPNASPIDTTAAYAYAAIPLRYVVDGRHFSQADTLTAFPPDFPWERFPIGIAMRRFGRAVGFARTGDTAGARREVEALRALRDAMPDARQGYDWKTQVDILFREAAAWLAQAEGRSEEAIDLMRSAAQIEDSTEKHPVTPGPIVPAREMLGELLLDADRPVEALAAYEASLRAAPNRLAGLTGAARAAEAGPANAAR